jgi:hopanoid biosynthesis associated protein HpnK
MLPDKPERRLIINADDFGRSLSINQAIIRAHQEGILTTASLMVNGGAFEDAVDLAQRNPLLGIGLHLTLICGSSALPSHQIPGLVDSAQQFSNNPALSGMRYFFKPGLRRQLFQEIEAQFCKFSQTGLVLDHINGHLNIHLHPTVFSLLMENDLRWGIKCLRLTRDPLRLNLKLDRGRWLYRLSHFAIFGSLSFWAKPHLKRRSIQYTRNVFGLLQTGHMDESYLLHLLEALPKGDSELYCHPCIRQAPHELNALLSAKAKQSIKQCKIQLVRYQDLST